MNESDWPVIQIPPFCGTHRYLLVHQSGYSESDPWRAMEVAANAVLFQGASCEDVVHAKLGGDITKLPSLGCLACLCPDKFNAVVEAAKTKKIGVIADLGKQWITEATQSRKVRAE